MSERKDGYDYGADSGDDNLARVQRQVEEGRRPVILRSPRDGSVTVVTRVIHDLPGQSKKKI